MNNNSLPSFLQGLGMWIWQVDQILGGSVQAIITKLKDNNVKYVMVKCGDGENTWEQWNPDLVAAFKDSGIALCSWSFVYGDNPIREAEIAEWALDMGSKLHVFDVEGQYEGKPGSAVTMLQAVRAHAPNALLAYSTFPIIDFHESLPYLEFGKYTDFVMPQCYWNDFQKSPSASVNWMFSVWSRWQETWKANGFQESIKPIIPTGSFYDITSDKINYVLSPSDINEFAQAVKGYGSFNCWSMQHLIRAEAWSALKNASGVFASPSTDLSSASTANQQSLPIGANVEPVANNTTGQSAQTTEAAQQTVTTTSSPTLPSSSVNPAIPASTVRVGEIPLSSSNQKMTVTIKRDESVPSGMSFTVHPQKVAIDYIEEFFTWLLSKLRGGAKKQ